MILFIESVIIILAGTLIMNTNFCKNYVFMNIFRTKNYKISVQLVFSVAKASASLILTFPNHHYLNGHV